MCEHFEDARSWILYIEDMIEFGERVLSYNEGLDQDNFLADRRTYDATLRNIELIGEAASLVPEYAREGHPDIPWRRIVGTRNRVAHGYLGIDNDVVWDIIQTDVPDLLPRLREMLEDAQSEEP